MSLSLGIIGKTSKAVIRVSCLVIRDTRREREGTADGEGQGSRHLPRRI